MAKKRVLPVLLALIMVFTMAACQGKEQEHVHKIGVVVYDLRDEQVQAFREYLEGYIAENFANVEFLYSTAITDEATEMDFLRDAIAWGAEGIMAFNSYDLKAEVELCAANKVYYIRPSSTVAHAEFQEVANNPYFLGYFGPGENTEYQAGFDMGTYFAQEKISDSYFILTGGAASGNEMHLQRAIGILDALQKCYGVSFSKTSQELASAQAPTVAEAGSLRVTLFSGYVGMEKVGRLAVSTFQMRPSGVVLGVIPLRAIADSLKGAKLGIIDCYTASNGELFKSGKLCYLTGKYQSIIAPAFAALYNAVTGYADTFREDGHAFAINQGFWTSTDYEDFVEKYALSSGVVMNAYSYGDIMNVCRAYNPKATLEDLKDLASGWDFDSALQRRK